MIEMASYMNNVWGSNFITCSCAEKLDFDRRVKESEWKLEFGLVLFVKPALESSDPTWKTLKPLFAAMLKNVLSFVLELNSQCVSSGNQLTMVHAQIETRDKNFFMPRH